MDRGGDDRGGDDRGGDDRGDHGRPSHEEGLRGRRGAIETGRKSTPARATFTYSLNRCKMLAQGGCKSNRIMSTAIASLVCQLEHGL